MATPKPLSTPSTPNNAVMFSMNQDTAVRPNPHPYAIRTTSTGILTRSNSSGHNAAASRHHYVPLSPTNPRRRHRYTKSLTDEPQPLPIPTTFTGNGRYESSSGGVLLAENFLEDNLATYSTTLEDLPSNPRFWSVSQLSTYLRTALRITPDDGSMEGSGHFLSLSAVEGIMDFIKGAQITGRIFLRLSEDDLEQRGLDIAWRAVLLNASRNLRQNVLKGRIWGQDPDSFGSSPTLPRQPFTHFSYNSSSSSLDLSSEDEASIPLRNQRCRGRVRGMVEKFERSGSFSSEGSFDRDGRQSETEWLRSVEQSDEHAVLTPDVDVHALVPAVADTSVDEPTVETLLAQSDSQDSWGAKAWEKFDATAAETMKKLDQSYEADTSSVESKPRLPSDSASRTRAGEERRIFTAIFAPPSGLGTVEAPQALDEQQDEPTLLNFAHIVDSQDDGQSDSQVSRETENAYAQTLETELEETRALVDAFRIRLEQVECKVAELELAARDWTNEPPVPPPPSEFPSAKDLPGLSDLNSDHDDHKSSHPAQPGDTQVDAAPSSDPNNVAAGLSELPQYVLLVGLGVCAVVLRVVLRKAVGRTSGTGWRW